MAKQAGKSPFPSRLAKKNERTPAEKALRKRKRLKYIAVLPTAVTLLNAFCGFLSIVYASRGPGIFLEVFLFSKTGISFFAASGYLIVFAMIADVLDGQVARWSGTASDFGGQLDSLSDAISFGAAPAFLMLKVMEAHFNLETFIQKFFFPISLWKIFPQANPHLIQLAQRWLLFVAIFYALCTIIRLARFNVENDTDLSRHQNFAGLPSPAAAGVVVILIIFQEDFIPDIVDRLPEFTALLTDVTSWLLPLAVLSSGILMVSRIRYPHVANKLFRGKKNFFTVLLVLLTGFLAVWNIQLAIFLGFWGFALFGIIRSIFTGIRALVRQKTPEKMFCPKTPENS
jgi:CDP-diacylglycerol--serine O-phosphatidyltransferase